MLTWIAIFHLGCMAIVLEMVYRAPVEGEAPRPARAPIKH
jgi:hypothetical protein